MKLNELHKLDEVDLLTDINKTEKSWTDGYPAIGKTFSFDKSDAIIKKGKIAGGSWVFTETSSLVSIKGKIIASRKEDDDNWMSDDRIIYGAEYALMGIDSAGKVVCIATLDKVANSYNVDHLVGKKNSSLPAFKMYAGFVRAGYILTTSAQSEGGMKVWQKLSAEPGVVVHGWNKRDRKPINLGPKFDDYSDTHSNDEIQNQVDYNDRKQRDHEYHLEKHVILVAAKK